MELPPFVSVVISTNLFILPFEISIKLFDCDNFIIEGDCFLSVPGVGVVDDDENGGIDEKTDESNSTSCLTLISTLSLL
ncbi:unnamed protein product [Schistosoma margrebowiei]|uniref:Uncharacterized protein n=1 Tax=Schistosoma margrebowiei TaxID=48269 RepID=A0A183MNN7_9TREM|nr:unnamed protein product [Schistosoma margrebowiei]